MHPHNTTPKRLIFGGAGTRLLCYIGALNALSKSINVHQIKEFIGVSAGSIISLLLSLKLSLSVIETTIMQYNFRDMFHSDPFSPDIVMEAADTWGLDDGTAFKKEIAKFLEMHGFSPRITFEQLHRLTKTHLRILACDIEDAKYYEFSYIKTPHIQVIDAVYASCAIPLYFYPARINNKLFVDGGLVHSFPLIHFTHKEISEAIGIEIKSKIIKKTPADSLEYFWRVVGLILNPPIPYKIPHNIYTIEVNAFFMDWSMTDEDKKSMIKDGYTQIMAQIKHRKARRTNHRRHSI
jgi:predicted acylesterase/phospholipase RssA